MCGPSEAEKGGLAEGRFLRAKTVHSFTATRRHPPPPDDRAMNPARRHDAGRSAVASLRTGRDSAGDVRRGRPGPGIAGPARRLTSSRRRRQSRAGNRGRYHANAWAASGNSVGNRARPGPVRGRGPTGRERPRRRAPGRGSASRPPGPSSASGRSASASSRRRNTRSPPAPGPRPPPRSPGRFAPPRFPPARPAIRDPLPPNPPRPRGRDAGPDVLDPHDRSYQLQPAILRKRRAGGKADLDRRARPLHLQHQRAFGEPQALERGPAHGRQRGQRGSRPARPLHPPSDPAPRTARRRRSLQRGPPTPAGPSRGRQGPPQSAA